MLYNVKYFIPEHVGDYFVWCLDDDSDQYLEYERNKKSKYYILLDSDGEEVHSVG